VNVGRRSVVGGGPPVVDVVGALRVADEEEQPPVGPEGPRDPPSSRGSVLQRGAASTQGVGQMASPPVTRPVGHLCASSPCWKKTKSERPNPPPRACAGEASRPMGGASRRSTDPRGPPAGAEGRPVPVSAHSLDPNRSVDPGLESGTAAPPSGRCREGPPLGEGALSEITPPGFDCGLRI